MQTKSSIWCYAPQDIKLNAQHVQLDFISRFWPDKNICILGFDAVFHCAREKNPQNRMGFYGCIIKPQLLLVIAHSHTDIHFRFCSIHPSCVIYFVCLPIVSMSRMQSKYHEERMNEWNKEKKVLNFGKTSPYDTHAVGEPNFEPKNNVCISLMFLLERK